MTTVRETFLKPEYPQTLSSYKLLSISPILARFLPHTVSVSQAENLIHRKGTIMKTLTVSLTTLCLTLAVGSDVGAEHARSARRDARRFEFRVVAGNPGYDRFVRSRYGRITWGQRAPGWQGTPSRGSFLTVQFGLPGKRFLLQTGREPIQPVPAVPHVDPPKLHQPLHGGHVPGQFIDCQVPLFPYVITKNAHEIAPGAIPVIVAVRDPRFPPGSGLGQSAPCVYVEIYVPNCPCQDIDISRDGTRIEFDYGDYEVKVTSCDGVVVVEYDD